MESTRSGYTERCMRYQATHALAYVAGIYTSYRRWKEVLQGRIITSTRGAKEHAEECMWHGYDIYRHRGC